MILTALLTFFSGLLGIFMSTIGGLLPTIEEVGMYDAIDNFIPLVTPAIHAFRFIAGPMPFILAPIILSLYTIYYFTIVPIKVILRIFIKGT